MGCLVVVVCVVAVTFDANNGAREAFAPRSVAQGPGRGAGGLVRWAA